MQVSKQYDAVNGPATKTGNGSSEEGPSARIMNLIDLAGWPTWTVILLFVGSSVAIAVAGTRMTRVADKLADVTGIGEAVFGAVLLGGSTSLAGIVTSLVTAYQGHPELAISNAVGNIAAQTTILAVADAAYRPANLEHAAASVENLFQGALLVVLLGIPLLSFGSPNMNVLGVHPLSVVLFLAYVFGLRLTRHVQAKPLWEPKETEKTKLDEPDEAAVKKEARWLWAWFFGLALVMLVAGYGVAESAIGLAGRTGLSETIVGGLLTAVVTASPELVTSVAAVQRGALVMAVGGIIGGNTFDITIVSLADVAYREGSIYHAVSEQQVFFIALTLVLNGLLLMGLLRREQEGIANIGFESALMLLLYVSSFLLLFFGG